MTRTPLVLVALSLAALAHGGEDHAPAPAPVPITQTRSAGAFAVSSAAYELVVRTAREKDGVGFTAFLSDYRTNEPLQRAEIALELVGDAAEKVAFTETPTPGMYRATQKLRPGSVVEVIARVRTGAGEELFTVSGFTLAPELEPAGSGGTSPTTAWLALLGITALGALAIVLLSMRRASGAAVLLLCAWAGAARAQEHEDHDHGHQHEDHAHEHDHEDEDHTHEEHEHSEAGLDSARPEAALSARGLRVHFPKEAQFLLKVRTLPVSERELQPRLTVLATVVPRADGHAALRASQPGRVVPLGGRLPVIGDRVSAGDALFAVEQSLGATEKSELRSRSVVAGAELRQAATRLAQAEQELARLKSLPGIASEREVRAAEAALELAREDRNRARAEVELYQNTPGGLQRQVFRAPISGTVVEAHLSVGGQVGGDELLLRIVDLSRLWLQADIYERDLPRIGEGATALLEVEGYPHRLFPARLLRPGQAVNPTTRTAVTLFEVDNPDGQLKPGMLGELAVAMGIAERVLAIPDSAVIEQEGRRFAYVHLAPEEFEAREVRLGRRDGGWVEVLAGLERGERVVTEGAYPLRMAAR